MKFLIALLTAATGILHLLVGLGMLGGGPTNWLLVLNGVGYLVLLVLFWRASGNGGTIRWLLLAYTLITLIGYFALNLGNNFGLNNMMALIIKAIELLLVILLLLYKGPQTVTATSPAAGSTRMGSGIDTTRSAGQALGTTAANTAAGASAATTATAAASVVMADRAGDAVVDSVDYVGDTADAAYDATFDVVDDAGDVVVDAGEVIIDTTGDAVDYVGDTTDAAYDATFDMVDDAGDVVEGTAVEVYDASLDVTRGVAVTEAGVISAIEYDSIEESSEMADDLSAERLATEPSEDEVRADLEEYLKSFGPSSEFRKPIEYVEGIGAAYGQKLRTIEINTVSDLVVNGATRRGRKYIADQTGIAQSLILTWVNHVDLYRIKGVAEEYADLLEQSGVDTVVELAQRNPANLYKRMKDVNEQKSLVRRIPHASDVESWVLQAKDLRRLIHY